MRSHTVCRVVAIFCAVTILTLTSRLVVSAAEEDAGLVDAIQHGNHAEVEAAIARGADVAASSEDGTTPLHWAAHAGNAAIVQTLLDAGADPQTANRYGVRPLALSSEHGNGEVVSLLLEAGADANAMTAEGETALMTAARTGSLDAVRVLLEYDADVNAAETWRGQTALMWAAAEGHAHIVPTMLSYGADVTARSNAGWSAMLFAAREGEIDVVQTLLEAGGDVEDALPVVEETRRGGSSAERSATGLNALLLAAANAHYELASLLVDRGADVNVASRGWTALHQVSWVRKAGVAGSNNPAPKGSGNVTSLDFVRKIVDAGADVNARVTVRPPAGITRLNFIGGTPFLLAARTGDADLMRLLVELGADPLAANEDNTTPIMVAAGVGTSSPGEDPGTQPEVLEAVQLALALGGNLNDVDDNGETVVHGAAYKHLPEVVSYLVEAGADVNIWNQPNAKGWTPLQIVEGVHIGMNIQSHPATVDAVREAMKQSGVGVSDES